MIMNEDDIVEEYSLLHILQNRKYLIVMDDVWTTDVWTCIHENFPDNGKGGKIVVTTRKRDVALRSGRNSPPHEVKLLSEHDSWKLFASTVFGSNRNCPPHLVGIGRCILGKCGGLPLAIKMMGGILSTKDECIDVWSRVFDSSSWQLNSDPISSILSMSYYDLPFYLRPCFLYFGVIPKGFEMPVKRLIRLWIAEGFVHKRDEEELEDVGKDYIEELVDRNIIQLSNKKDNIQKFLHSIDKEQHRNADILKSEGRKLTCSVHDLVRELPISIAKEANFLGVYTEVNYDTSSNLSKVKVRRLALHSDKEKLPSLKCSFQSLHFLLIFDHGSGKIQGNETVGNYLHKSIFSKGFELLKVLHLESTYKPKLPEALGQLIHLRYLGLRGTWLDKLPSSTTDLFNLQVLDLKGTNIQFISELILQRSQLRHLYLNGLCNISRSWSQWQPSGYHITNLQTLSGGLLRNTRYFEELTKFSSVTKIRKLGLEGGIPVMTYSDISGWISKLTRLEHLKLKYTSVGEQPPDSSSSSIAIPTLRLDNHVHLSKLHLHGQLSFNECLFDNPSLFPNLTSLTLVGSLLHKDPMQQLGMFPNLRIIRLWYNSYVGGTMLCISEGFRVLEILELCWLDKLEEWTLHRGAMPNLRELEVNKCNQLKMLPDGLQNLTNLKELRLPAMSYSLRMRVSPIGRDWHKIQHIPFIRPPLCSLLPHLAPLPTP